MPVQELERGCLSTSPQSAENKPSQTPENVIYFNHPLIEFRGNLLTSVDLQKAGWDSFAEIKRFIGDVNLGLIKGLTLEQAVAFSTQVFVEHFLFYDAEFIKQEPVLPHHNYFGMWQGEKRVLGNNGRPAVHAIDETERVGSAKRAAQKAEEYLLGADNNSFIVSMSAQGVSGYLDEDGLDIPHLNTYILVDWKDQDGNLKGMTLVTDLTIDQAEKVMRNLGVPANFSAKRGNEMQRLANLLENLATPALPVEYSNPVSFVLDQMLDVRGEEDMHLKQKNGPDEIRSVAEIKQKIASFEAILDMDVTKARLIREFQDFVLADYDKVQSSSFQQKIVEMAEETVFLFAKYFKITQKRDSLTPSFIGTARCISYEDNREIVRLAEGVDRRAFFAAEIAFLQSRAGCPSSRNYATGREGATNSLSSLGESDSKGSLYFACPVCGAINKRPYEGYVDNCQSCGTDKVSCQSSETKTEERQEEKPKVISLSSKPVEPVVGMTKAA